MRREDTVDTRVLCPWGCDVPDLPRAFVSQSLWKRGLGSGLLRAAHLRTWSPSRPLRCPCSCPARDSRPAEAPKPSADGGPSAAGRRRRALLLQPRLGRARASSSAAGKEDGCTGKTSRALPRAAPLPSQGSLRRGGPWGPGDLTLPGGCDLQPSQWGWATRGQSAMLCSARGVGEEAETR